MIVFIVGSSSVGKTKLLHWLKRKKIESFKVKVLNADHILGKIRNDIWKYEYPHLSWSEFQKTNWLSRALTLWRSTIAESGKNSKNIVLVDTVVRGLHQDIAYLKHHHSHIPFKVICVGVDLAHLFWNILQRNIKSSCPKASNEVRSATSVLEEVSELWRVTDQTTPLQFSVKHLQYFSVFVDINPSSWVAKGLRQQQIAFAKKYFSKQENKVYVTPNWVGWDIVVVHHKTYETGRQILTYLRDVTTLP